MSPSPTSQEARAQLRHLSCHHALDFCSRLLNRSIDGILTFPEFLATARELIEMKPDDSALYLATLVALDMGSPDNDDEPPMRPHMPSRN